MTIRRQQAGRIEAADRIGLLGGKLDEMCRALLPIWQRPTEGWVKADAGGIVSSPRLRIVAVTDSVLRSIGTGYPD